MKNKILFILFSVLLITSCRKDEISDEVINQPPASLTIYETDLLGRVVDQNGEAVRDAILTSGAQSVISDSEGFFKIDGLKVDGTYGAYISADASGYFTGGDRLYTQGTHNRQLQITLIQKELSGSVNSALDETVSLQSGLEIDFPANGFTSNGADYNGVVSIYAYHLDPSEEGYLQRSPGDLSGTDESNNNYSLESFGMLAVEMETADGQPVQLKEGEFAMIKVPVDETLLSDAPSELPLWHFDDVLHKWIKEGSAELVDGSYVGQVPHFSWWNCDDFIEAANLCIQVVDSRFNGSLSGIVVELYTDAQGSTYGTTDSEGYISGLVPANEIITVTIYDQCGEEVYSAQIGPYTGDGNKEYIPVFFGNVDLYTFTGTVYDCESMDFLAGSIVTLEVGNESYYTETDESGVYSVNALACEENEQYTISAYSFTEGVFGVTEGTTTLGVPNVVDINLCVEDVQFLINGEIMDTDFVTAKRKPFETIIEAGTISGGSLLIGFYGFSTGTFPAFVSGGGFNSNVCTVTITQYDGLGGAVVGSVVGEDTSGGNAVITAFFTALRVE